MSGARIGYARVSTDLQTTALQLAALKAAGCSVVFEETAGGAARRPQLEAALSDLKPGDVLTVWKFDRLARSLADLLRIAAELDARGAHLASLTEQIDTSTSAGRMVFHVMGALAQFERDLIAERTAAGMRAAKDRGARLGRPRALAPRSVQRAVAILDADPGATVASLAAEMRVGVSTLRAAVAAFRARRGDEPAPPRRRR